jgi:hypothetical protein
MVCWRHGENFNEPTKLLEALIKAGNHHNSDPVPPG